MSPPYLSSQRIAHLRQILRQCRAERYQCRSYATATEQRQPLYPSLQPKYPAPVHPSDRPLWKTERDESKYPMPTSNFRTSQTTKQNRFDSPTMKPIPTHPPPRSTHKLCPDPVRTINTAQIAVLDPTGARTRLFAPSNPDRAQPGDILLVRLKNSSDPFAGVCLNIRQRHHPVDTAILLRNTLTRVGVEMWFKVYSPNVEGIEIVQRKEKRARRAKLYYMRQARHDVGSVEGVVRTYLRQRVGGGGGKAGGVRSQNVKGRDANSAKKKSGHRGKNASR